MHISFCTTCFNRFDQLRETLEYNCSITEQFDNVELVIVNFLQGSESHKIDKWIKSNFKNYLASGHLVYKTDTILKNWHSSIAKNISHQYGKGYLLYNLDCDNFLDKGEIDFLLSIKNSDPVIYHGFGALSMKNDGTFGRVCIPKHLFHQLGGYNEYFLPGGYQDIDLLLRAEKLSDMPILKTRFSPIAIANSKKDHMKYVNIKYRLLLNDEINWKISATINKLISKYNIRMRKYCLHSSIL